MTHYPFFDRRILGYLGTLLTTYNTPMRYRLRTLLIVLAICGVVFARIGYLKRQAGFHRREAMARLTWIANRNHTHREMFATPVRQDEVDNPEIWRAIRANPPMDEAGSPYYVSAYYHLIMAHRYERAIYRPWQIVSQTE